MWTGDLVGPMASLKDMQERKTCRQENRRLGGSNGQSEGYAGEKSMWTGDLVGPMASLKDMPERKTCGQETWWVQWPV